MNYGYELPNKSYGGRDMWPLWMKIECRELITGWVAHPRPRGCPYVTWGRTLKKALNATKLTRISRYGLNKLKIEADGQLWSSQIKTKPKRPFQQEISALPAEAHAMATEQQINNLPQTPHSNKYRLFVQHQSKRLLEPFTGLRRMRETG